MRQEILEILLKASGAADPNVRKAAAIALGGADNPHAKTALIKLLKDKVWQVREAAIYSLGKLKVVEAAPYMLAILGAENEAAARGAILKWAAARGEPPEPGAGGAAPLGAGEKAKPPDVPWQLRKAAALTLSSLRPDIVIEPLVAALNTENPSARIAALAGLGAVQAEQAADSIIAALSDGDWNIRKVAATTLGRLKSQEAVPHLYRLLEDEKFSVRVEAVIAINHIKPPDALEALSKAVISDNNYEVRKTAATALGNLKDERAADALYRAAEDENWMTRKAAIDALTNLRIPAAETMIMHMADEQEDVRAAAAAGIIRLSLLMG